ncbi:MAG: DNA polymerase/3'-5' exonuclease PolX [bacterium]|nr:DNA polymerase/3'-5' exonuclease PolX [bacterium]
MAELLAIQGNDPHRSRAFHRVARVIENLPEPIERMLRYGTLRKSPGIGDGTIHRVKQILRTGTCDDLLRLRAALPPGLRELIRLKGLGAKTVRRLYRELGIRTVQQLETAARSGLLGARARFGVDRVHKLLHEIQVYKLRLGKVPLIEALATAEKIAAELRALPQTIHAGEGGSLRRRKALIGDLDLLVASDDPEPVIDRFVHLPEVATVLGRRRDGGRVRLATGQQADLWVFSAASWGAGLHAFSGSKQHVVAMRTRAGRYGIHLSEHGISSRHDGRRLHHGAFEEEIFAAVGLPIIAPELRENLGEIEAAERGRLPSLITAEDLRGDLHMHTRASDGSGSAREMARAAVELGYEYMAVTDHSQSLSVANGLDERRLAAQVDQLRRLEQEMGCIHVLAGIEVNILADGRVDLDPAALRRLDWVVASVHDHLDMDGEEMTSRMLRAMETGLVDCIGHPTGRRLGRREPCAVDLDRLLGAARRLGVAMEVNGDPNRMDLDEVGCRQARELGVEVVISTDAHSPAHLARRRFGLASARRGWLEKKHVLNTRPVEAIRELRADRLRGHGIAVPRRAVPSFEPAEAIAASAPERDTAGLAAALDAAPLDATLVERLERYLREGDDPELEAALRQLSDNPIQQAFNLLATAP